MESVRDQPSLIIRDGVLLFVGKSIGNVGDTAQKLRANRLKALSDWKPQRRR
ncbi:MAG TPA: hypothetical protein VEK15_28330 [Vicinamibacteria bacterium]|nr:hypothetical protein [Vicinamibacteria bacterium]